MSKEVVTRAKDVIKDWEEGGYDNLKDAIMDCRDLLDTLDKKAEAEIYKKIEAVLIQATTEYKKMVGEVGGMSDDIGLVDPSYLEK